MKQLVCYIYEYENNRQKRNVGFVKCMRQEGKMIVEMHGKGMNCDAGNELKMYLLSAKEDGSEIEKVGLVEGQNRVVNYQMEIDDVSEDKFKEYDGVYLCSKQDNVYIAVWSKRKPDLGNVWEKSAQEIYDVGSEEIATEITFGEEDLVDVTEEEEEQEVIEVLKEEIEEVVESGEQVEEVDAIEYEKIERQMLSVLPQREWRLANNSFLLHGYYNYKHLLFIREKGNLFLGVPGEYHSKEAEAAKAFGFPQFHKAPLDTVNLSEGEYSHNENFGYWCRPVSQRKGTES